MKITALEACPGCRSTDARLFDLEGHELRQCSNCGLIHVTEFGDPEEIYVEGYLTGGTDFGLDLSDPLFQEFLAYAGGLRVDALEARVGRGGGSWLDVGCGNGELLEVAAQRGWTTGGAEPVAESADYARNRGLDVRTAMIEDSGFEQGSWDVVSAYHVLEHMTDGVGFLESIKRWAAPGGVVAVEVPNWGSVERINKGRSWPSLRPLEHVAHYDADNLRTTLENAGLRDVTVGSMGFLWEKQDLDQQLSDLAHGRWKPLLKPFTSKRTVGGKVGQFPWPPVRAFLRAVQRSYDKTNRGQVLLGVGYVSD